MSTPIRIKRSAVAGKKPTKEQLQLGELAVNFYDGKVFFKQDTNGVGIGTRIVEIGAGSTSFAGKTLYVTNNGDDDNTGLDDTNAKATIKAAVALAVPGDTVKVLPGTYIENNPINLPDNVSVEGTELRRCLVAPQNVNADLFYVSQGSHITDLSFIGGPMTDSAAVISFRPLVGVSSDRFFDAARLIRQNLDFIANEAVGYLTSTDYKNPAFVVTKADGTPDDAQNCRDDIKDIYRAICHDITRGGNSKSVDAGKSYYTNAGALQHITGSDSNGYSLREATIAAIDYSRQIARAVVTNSVWGGDGSGSTTNVTGAVYGKTTGILTVTSANHGLSKDNPVKLSGLEFTCSFGTSTYPDGKFGYIFPVKSVVGVNTFEVNIGISTIDHTYTSGGIVEKHQPYQNTYPQVRDLSIQGDPFTGYNNVIPSCSNVVSAVYTCAGIVTTIINGGLSELGGSGINTNFPGNNGAINSGILTATLSPLQGTGVISKGPYIRNCTNFIPDSIGARIDGFNADEGDQINNIGVQGSFNVDSYTQFNQGGIGVSVTNGAYCQLVSIFTICDDIAIYAGGGGQLDLTNSNSSFGTKGLVAEGIGDQTSKCSDRYTGTVSSTGAVSQNIVIVSGIGNNRPYDGQALYFDRKYFVVKDITVTNGGSGYTTPPIVTIDSPTGPGIAIPAQATATVENGAVTVVTVRSAGSQYIGVPNITFTGGGGSNAAATAQMEAIYYDVLEATAPSAGITTISLVQNLNNEVGVGTTVYFARQSFQIVSSHSFQYIGAGNTIETAYPSKSGVPIPDNEVITDDGGKINYTSTDQTGNFRIGNGVVIDQLTGTVTGNVYVKSLFTQVTPFILALGGD
tara:strand:- start:1272 stop:3833 length:2562 start_codon:yes stop_codon:yes gene_type:complete